MPLTVRWAAQSRGDTIGTKGYASYTMQDGHTTVTVDWNKPPTGSDGYSISLDGPLQDQYKCTCTGGDGENATIEVTLRQK